jgi:spermidine synthase
MISSVTRSSTVRLSDGRACLQKAAKTWAVVIVDDDDDEQVTNRCGSLLVQGVRT